ncbi:MAG: sigma 54-interacting transcriptional regulator [Candidatus Eisenbacteria bacterium]
MSTHSNSIKGSRAPGTPRRLDATERRSTLELARIYVSSSAFPAALEALDRLPQNGWDEEAQLLRAEGLIGVGRLADAENLLGAPVLPEGVNGERGRKARMSLRAGAVRALGERKSISRVERFALWRFLLQLRVLHRTGRSDQVLALGRAFFGRASLPGNAFSARIATVVAQAMLSQNRPSEARDLYEQILELYKDLHSREGVADTLLGIANTHLLDCHWDEADALYQECRYRYEELGQSDKALAATINLGVLRVKRGEFTSGRSLLDQALRRASQLGDKRRTASIHLGLAMAEGRCGSPLLAEQHLRNAFGEARRTKNRRTQALFLEFLGEHRLLQGQHAKARRTLELGLRIARKISAHGDIVFEIERRLAESALHEGHRDEASEFARRSAKGAQDFGDTYEVAVAERVLAEIDEARGNLRSALERADMAAAALDRLGETYERARLEILRLRLRHQLGRIAPEVVRSRIRAVTRSYQGRPDSPVLADARRLLDVLAGPVSIEVDETGPERDPELPESRPFSDDDERMLRAVGFATKDPGLRQALALARRVAELPVPVLILGESGTGREKLARLIHGWSKRVGIYMPFHCADLPSSYLEAELFGDDVALQGGVLFASHQGTLFLDEISELPADLQRRLLLWVRQQEGGGYGLDLHPESLRPDWGSEDNALVPEWQGMDVRVIAAATIRNEGPHHRRTIRDDLYRSLGRVVIEIPPLRDRRGDIPLLARGFLEQERERSGRELPDIPPALMHELVRHDWPGNLYDLRRAVSDYADGHLLSE